MPEHDDGGDRLRREFLRQAPPPFDLQSSLPGKVAALVRRRRRQRRILAVGATVVVAAAVAIPLSALRSEPVGHGVIPAAPSTTSPPVTAPTTTITTTTTTTTTTAPSVALAPFACNTLDLWTTPAGTAITTTATLGDVTATLTGTTATSTSGVPELTGPELSVDLGSTHFSEAVTSPAQAPAVIPWGLTLIPATTTSPNSDALCLARFPGDTLPALVLGLSTGEEHCCTVLRAIALSAAGLAPAVDDDVGNPGAALEPDGDDAMIVTEDNAFAYKFSSYAESGMPLKLLQFSGSRFVDITSQRTDLVTADAAMWMKLFNTNASSGNGLGQLAPWVADECRLGQSASAWATVNQLLAAGKLSGPTGWPSGAAYIQALKTFLTQQGYC